MKILVTGATGFLGRNLTEELDKNKFTYYILSRKKNKDFTGSLFDKTFLLKATKNIDIIMHLAGSDKGDVFKINYEGTKNLVEAAKENKVKKIIYISSHDITTDTDYGKSKLKAEEAIKESKINYIILRPTVFYGKDNNKDIGKLIEIIKKYKFVPIPGNGNFKLQPLYVKDLVNIIIKSIKLNNKEYFIAGSQQLTFNDLVDIISKNFSKKIYKIKIPKFIVKLKNKTLLHDKICNINEIKKDFNFTPLSFEEGINLIT